MIEIPIKSRIALIDDEDFELVDRYTWQLLETEWNIYATTLFRHSTILMHRLIMDFPKGKVIHHKDRNGLNNQRSNLEVLSQSQNQIEAQRGSGVNFHFATGKWVARVKRDYSETWLGSFDSRAEALAVRAEFLEGFESGRGG